MDTNGGLYGGLASGLDHGLDLGERIGQRSYENQRQAKLDQQTEAQRQFENKRQTTEDNNKTYDSAIADANDQLNALHQQAGESIKNGQAVDPKITSQMYQLQDRKRTAYAKKSGGDVLGAISQAGRDAADLKAGKVQLADLPGERVHDMIAYTTGIDPLDFLDKEDGTPGKIGSVIKTVHEKASAGDMKGALRAMNPIVPETKIGVGDYTHDGSLITDKRLVDAHVHPDDPNHTLPELQVSVRRADGTPGTYKAPVTENRSTSAEHPDDNVKSVPMQAWFERLGQATTLHQAINTPEVREKLLEAKAAGAHTRYADAKQALLASGGTPSEMERRLKMEHIDLGDRTMVEERDDQGNIVSRKEYKKGATPRVFAPERAPRTGIRATMDEIDAQEVEGTISPDEATQAKRDLLTRVSSPNVGASGRPNEAHIKGDVKAKQNKFLADEGFNYDPASKGYVDAAGNAAAPEDNTRIRKGLAEIDATERKIAPDKPGAAAKADPFIVNRTYLGKNGKQAKYLGNGKWGAP